MLRVILFIVLAFEFMVLSDLAYPQQASQPVLLQAVEQNLPALAEELLSDGSFNPDQDSLQLVTQAFERNVYGGEWIGVVERLLERYPQQPRLSLVLARMYWRAGDVDSCLKFAGNAVQLDPNDQNLLYQAAALAQTSNRPEEAKTWLKMLLEKNPNDGNAMFLLGRILANEGDLAEAEKVLQSAVEFEPKNYLARFEFGRLKNRTGSYVDAEAHLREAVNLYPFFTEAFNTLLVVLARQKKAEEVETVKAVVNHLSKWSSATEDRLRFSFFNPDKINPKESYELSAELCFVNRSDLAKKYLERFVEKGESSEPHLYLLAQLRFKDKEYDGCLTLLERVTHPTVTGSETFMECKAWSLYQTGKLDECVPYLKQALLEHSESTQLKELAVLLAKRDTQSVSNTPDAKTGHKYSISFKNMAEQVGLTSFRHTQGNADKRWIIDAMGSGVAVADYDSDGDDDIYFVNAQPDVFQPDPKYRNTLFRNDGGTFTDVTDSAGVGDAGYGMCAVFGDIDNDGDLDLFVGNYGPNALYRNNGDGTFSLITEEANVAHSGYAAAAAFADVNNDGWLDLYVGNYVAFDPNANGGKQDLYNGLKVFAGPLVFPHQDDLLYINQGSGTFKETAKMAGINVSEGRAMSAAFFDFENDDDLDLYVANDSTYNHALGNNGGGVFDDISFMSGTAFNESGVAGGSMGVAVGDYDNNGLFDLYVTAYEQMSDVLYRNDGGGLFTDVTGAVGLTAPSWWLVTWGTGFCDFDADGLLDLYSANGHIYPQIDSLGLDRSYFQGVSVYRQSGGKFVDISADAFEGGLPPISGRGSALLDYDLDGDMDVVVNCIDATPLLLKNQSSGGNWLQVILDGTSAQTFGTRVVAKKGDRSWTRIVDGGSGYLSQNSQRLHFGFGEVDEIDEITVYWRGRGAQSIKNPPLNRLLTITQSYRIR